MRTKHSRLEALRKKMLKANLPLKATAKMLVFGAVNPDASIMFVGEAPGRHEDEKGMPFMGSAGKVLDELLSSIGLQREDIYITSILKYRPPKNRNPKLDEIIAHTPYLVDQIRIIQPKIIVTLGNFAARFVLNGFKIEDMQKIPGIASIHGKMTCVSLEQQEFCVMALYHPAAVLYNPKLRQILKKDFKVLAKLLNA